MQKKAKNTEHVATSTMPAMTTTNHLVPEAGASVCMRQIKLYLIYASNESYWVANWMPLEIIINANAIGRIVGRLGIGIHTATYYVAHFVSFFFPIFLSFYLQMKHIVGDEREKE